MTCQLITALIKFMQVVQINSSSSLIWQLYSLQDLRSTKERRQYSQVTVYRLTGL